MQGVARVGYLVPLLQRGGRRWGACSPTGVVLHLTARGEAHGRVPYSRVLLL